MAGCANFFRVFTILISVDCDWIDFYNSIFIGLILNSVFLCLEPFSRFYERVILWLLFVQHVESTPINRCLLWPQLPTITKIQFNSTTWSIQSYDKLFSFQFSASSNSISFNPIHLIHSKLGQIILISIF